MTIGNGVVIQAAGGAEPDGLERIVDAVLQSWPPALSRPEEQ
ncbi:TetR family transcriptional regulator [Streptomyces sp. TRM75563]